jgi:DNA-binding transcriptional LysR family regulator
MARHKIDLDRRLGHRLQLRDLLVFSTVAECGSMAKAAVALGIAQPTVSEVIANLEHTYGVRLFDRSPRGVQPTVYGDALLTRSIAVFDEIKQSGRDIEFLADPTVGEMRIGCAESLSATILPQILLQFSHQYPRVIVSVDDLTAPAIDMSGLRDRKYDCTLIRLVAPISANPLGDDLSLHTLFDDGVVVAAGVNNSWARRRKVDIADLIDEPWVLVPPGSWHYVRLEEAFRARGLGMPKTSLISLSLTLRTQLMAAGPYLSVFASSVMRLNAHRYGIAVLPIELPHQPWPVVLVTLKNRTLSPVVDRFIACARQIAKSYTVRRQVRR